MLLFSVKKGNISPAAGGAIGMLDDIKFAIYLNILAVIVLAEPAERFSDKESQEGPEAFGVDSIPQLPDAEESESEGDGDKTEEPFL
jgi:hypothetical protein